MKRNPIPRWEQPDVSTRRQLGGTIAGMRGKVSPHLLKLAEMVGDSTGEGRRMAEIVGLLPKKDEEPAVRGWKLAPELQAVLDEITASPEFQVSESQWHLWENQFKPNEAINAPLQKYELFIWATRHLLPLIGLKAPTIWPVYCYLLMISPDDFTSFKLSNRKLAQGAGVGLRSVTGAIDHLHELKFITAQKGVWSPSGPKAATLPVYRLTTLAELEKEYVNGAINAS